MVRKHVAPMFHRVRKENLSRASVTINEPSVNATISYDAGQRFSSLSYPSYRAAYSLTRNTVYLALKGKLDQLKKSGRPGPLGIFLCDGDYELLNHRQKAVENAGIGEIIAEFFRRNSSISFVALLTFPPTTPAGFPGLLKQLRLTGQVFVNRRAKCPLDENTLRGALNRAFAHMPAPVATPRDALYWLSRGPVHHGEPLHRLIEGSKPMGHSLKISARKIQEVLAGQMSAEQLWSEYERIGSPIKNAFLRALESGLTIRAVKLTRIPEADDDLLEFEFGPDVAIGKIVAEKPQAKPAV